MEDTFGAALARQHVTVVIEDRKGVVVLEGSRTPLLQRRRGGDEELRDGAIAAFNARVRDLGCLTWRRHVAVAVLRRVRLCRAIAIEHATETEVVRAIAESEPG